MIDPPLPHLTGGKNTGDKVRTEPVVPLVLPILTFILSVFILLLAVYVSQNVRRNWFLFFVYLLVGASQILLSITMFGKWLRQRKGNGK